MLRSRVITSVILAALVISALLLLPVLWLNVVLAGLFLVAGGWESARLAGLEPRPLQVAWIALLCGLGAGLVWLAHDPAAVPWLFGSAVAGWLLLSTWLLAPDLGRVDGRRFQPAKLLIVGAILLFAFLAVSWLHVSSPWRVIFLLFLIAAADIGAFFTGHRIGGAKLYPRISPGKTWSGAVGGLVSAMVVAAACSRLMPDIPFGPLVAASAAAVLVVISVCGDLVISLFKRHRNLKDTSSLLPGHGGMLDRVDSLSAAAPAFALLVWWHAA